MDNRWNHSGSRQCQFDFCAQMAQAHADQFLSRYCQINNQISDLTERPEQLLRLILAMWCF